MRIKIKTIKILIYLAVIFSLCGCFRSDITNLESKGKNVICFGDSITMGYGVRAGEDYPAALAKLSNYPIINSGIDGEISSEAIKRLKTDVLEKDPLLVIVEFGGNDLLRKIPLEETVSNLEQIIKDIHASGAMVALVDIGSSLVMPEYSQEYKKLADKYKTIFIPQILKNIISNQDLKSDLLHPNARGYLIIAHRVYRAIIPYLNQNAIINRFKK